MLRGGYHLANVLEHAAGACLFALVLRRLGQREDVAWLAAFLFALHPVCVESAAWISEQKNTLSLVFYLLAALAYLRFDETRGQEAYWLATCMVPPRPRQQDHDGDLAGGSPRGFLVAARPAVLAAGCGAAPALVRPGGRRGPFLRVGRAHLYGRPGGGLQPEPGATLARRRAGGLVLPRQTLLARAPDLHLPPLAARRRGRLAVAVSRRRCCPAGRAVVPAAPDPRPPGGAAAFRRDPLPDAGIFQRLCLHLLLRRRPLAVPRHPGGDRARRGRLGLFAAATRAGRGGPRPRRSWRP